MPPYMSDTIATMNHTCDPIIASIAMLHSVLIVEIIDNLNSFDRSLKQAHT